MLGRWLAVVAVASLGAAIACSEDTTETAVILPAGPASLAIVSPRSGACVEPTADEQLSLTVGVEATNWTLRPPGGCGIVPQCGIVKLTLDPDGEAGAGFWESAATTVVAQLAGIEDLEGTHVLRVELIDETGRVGVDADGGALSQQIEVDLRLPGGCSDAGVGDAAPDGDAGDDGTDASDGDTDAGDAGTDAGDAGDAGVDAPGDAVGEAPADAVTESAVDAPAAASDALFDAADAPPEAEAGGDAADASDAGGN